jgi:hypothetical protein
MSNILVLVILCVHIDYYHSEELKINVNTIPSVKQFKYLGSVVQENGSLTLKLKKGLVKQEELAC